MGKNLWSHTNGKLTNQNPGFLGKVKMPELVDHHDDSKNQDKR